MSDRWRRGLATALAAACVLCATAMGWWLGGSALQQGPIDKLPIPQPSIAGLRLIDQWTDQATTGLDGLVASATLQPHAAKLEHDARLIANAFLEPLPVEVRLASDR